jgi:type VI secretion system protein ImpH
VVGPLTHARYLDFLPIGESLVRMISLIKLYVGNDFRFEIQLVLQNKEVPLSWLGNDVRLGWTSWLGVRVTDTDARDYVAIL